MHGLPLMPTANDEHETFVQTRQIGSGAFGPFLFLKKLLLISSQDSGNEVILDFTFIEPMLNWNLLPEIRGRG